MSLLRGIPKKQSRNTPRRCLKGGGGRENTRFSVMAPSPKHLLGWKSCAEHVLQVCWLPSSHRQLSGKFKILLTVGSHKQSIGPLRGWEEGVDAQGHCHLQLQSRCTAILVTVLNEAGSTIRQKKWARHITYMFAHKLGLQQQEGAAMTACSRWIRCPPNGPDDTESERSAWGPMKDDSFVAGLALCLPKAAGRSGKNEEAMLMHVQTCSVILLRWF